jgi:hypothetical protein
VGIVTDEGKATELAHLWRLDESYPEAVTELVSATYPDSLVHIAPPGEAERQKVVTWFKREGLGEGAAGNKAATYLLLSSPTPNEAPKPAAKAGQGDSAAGARPTRRQATNSRRPAAVVETPASTKGGGERSDTTAARGPESFPLNVNVQIHISADAGTEQIESIFQAMRRYLYDAPAS